MCIATLLAYADDIDIIGRTMQDVTAGSGGKSEQDEIYAVDSGVVLRMGCQITVNIYNFDMQFKRQLSSRDLTRAQKLTLYKALILPVLLYDADA